MLLLVVRGRVVVMSRFHLTRAMSNSCAVKSASQADGQKKGFQIWNRRGRWSGLSQMTVVESALCPLHKQSSLQPGGRHRSHFYYSTGGKRKRARVEVTSVYGLSANDEFYLWGLLALTFVQEDPQAVFHATPHYCLRQLGVLDGKTKPGGKTYRDFREALKRLAGVTYWCDAFYDPLRGERRERMFHFLSFDLPVDPAQLAGLANRVGRVVL